MISDFYSDRGVNSMTERQLEDEADRLRRLLKEGNATPAQAARYAEIQRALQCIRAVKRGRMWW